MSNLPLTGTADLLDRLSPFIPDQLVNSLFPRHQGRGRRAHFSAAQLFRVLLLALLTPVHSFNLLTAALGENRRWRRFALLRNASSLPDVRMLHEFRQKLRPLKLRQINAHLLEPWLETFNPFSKTVAVMDATDLPAATNAYKKNRWATLPKAPPWEDEV
jgi:transposase-like protein DUF772